MRRAMIQANENIRNFELRLDSFKGGTNTIFNEARTPKNSAVESINLIQVQDGLWKTRPGVNYYGEEIPGVGTIDGSTEFEKDDRTREIIAIAGGKVWKSNNGGTWTELTGATFTAGISPFFIQIKSRLYVSNGLDPLAYYSGGTTLAKYSSIAAPVGLSGTKGSGLAAGSNNNYYRIVAINDVGYTTPSESINVPTDSHRDTWTDVATEYIDLSWTAVENANGYQIYWGEFDGEEVYLGSASANSFRDDGVAQPNEYIETPNDNTTVAPKFRHMEISGQRFWATYDKDNPWRVYWSGTGQYMAYFSPFYGGGYVDIEKGGKNRPVAVVHYRTGKGDPAITVLCSSADGRGAIFQLDISPTTIGDTTFVIPYVYKIVGGIGADSPYSVVKVGDNIFFANKNGFFALRNKDQMFNVLSTDDLSSPIRNKYQNITPSRIKDIAGYFKSPHLFNCVAQGDKNDTTVIFDFERKNWNWAWTIGFRQMFEYTENIIENGENVNGKTRLLAVPTSGNRLVEISENYKGDFGQGFYQSYISPLFEVSDDYTDRAKIKHVIFNLGNFQGQVTLEVLGMTADKQVSSLGTRTYESSTGTTGIGDDLFSEFLFSDTNDVPKTFSSSTQKKTVRVGKKIYGIQFRVYSNTPGTTFEILGILAKGFILPGRPPAKWNK